MKMISGFDATTEKTSAFNMLGEGVTIEYYVKPKSQHKGALLLWVGSAMWSDRFCRGPLPVTAACDQKPRLASIARRPAGNAVGQPHLTSPSKKGSL